MIFTTPANHAHIHAAAHAQYIDLAWMIYENLLICIAIAPYYDASVVGTLMSIYTFTNEYIEERAREVSMEKVFSFIFALKWYDWYITSIIIQIYKYGLSVFYRAFNWFCQHIGPFNEMTT